MLEIPAIMAAIRKTADPRQKCKASRGTSRQLRCPLKTLLAGAFIVFHSFAPATAADKTDALAEIKASGTLRVGTLKSTPPFSFEKGDGRFAGFSVDLLHMIRRFMSQHLNTPITLKFKTATQMSRYDLLNQKEIHLICGLGRPTWPRDHVVDYTIPIFVDGTRILTYRGENSGSLARLQEKRIGVVGGTATGKTIALALPSAHVIGYPSLQRAMSAMQSGAVAAIADMGIQLETLRLQASNSQDLTIVPRGGSLHRVIMACAVPHNESRLRDIVNRAISDALRGLRDLSGTYADIYFRWFGVNGMVYYPLLKNRRDTLLASRIWLE